MAAKKAPDKLDELNALAARIESHRAELDSYLDAYARLLTPNGVPTVAIRQMIDAKGMCICHSALYAIAEQVAAIELERKAS